MFQKQNSIKQFGRHCALITAACYTWSFALTPVLAAVEPKANSQAMAPMTMIVPQKVKLPHGAKVSPQTYFPYLETAAKRATEVPSPQSITHGTVASPTLLNEVGLIDGKIQPDKINQWKSELSAHPTPIRAAQLHIWLGEWQLAKNEQPDTAIQHFQSAQHGLNRRNPLFGLAAYDSAIALFYAGAYAQARHAFQTLLLPKTRLAGYETRKCTLWLRHAGACANYHAEHTKIGIPEPPRLDPICGAAALAAALQHLGRPSDRKTVLKVCRVTGEGSTLQDVVTAAGKLGVTAHVLGADDKGLIALPKPLVAYVERDHFIAVIRADKRGVTYLCSDCGMWPGGAVSLTWAQWHTMNAGVYAAITVPGSPWDKTLQSLLNGGLEPSKTIAVASRGSLAGLGGTKFLAMGPSVSALRPHVFRQVPIAVSITCGSKLGALHCKSQTHCPKDGDPVNLATGEEEYHSVPDLVVYNPHGPSVVWGRSYNSLRPAEEPGYNSNDFGVGWSQSYNSNVLDPNLYIAPNGCHWIKRHGDGTIYLDIDTSWQTTIFYYPTGDIYLNLPNGASVKATSHVAPGLTSPPHHIDLTVPTGTGMLVQWDTVATEYGFNIGTYTVTMPDRTRFIFNNMSTDAIRQSYGEVGVYSLNRIIDRNGHFINFYYENYQFNANFLVISSNDPPLTHTAQIDPFSMGMDDKLSIVGPLLVQITDEQDHPLLTIGRYHPPTSSVITYANRFKVGNIQSVWDCYGRHVYYNVGTYDVTNTPAAAPQYFQELDHVSQVQMVGQFCTPIPDGAVYEYTNIGNTDGGVDGTGETVPFLTGIKTPSPTGDGMKTLNINYNPLNDMVTSVVDGNGNKHVYTQVDPGHTKVSLQNDANQTVFSHTVGFGPDMAMVSDTDGTNTNLIYQATYADANDLFEPSSVEDGEHHVSHFTWDPNGNLTSSTSSLGVVTTFNWSTAHFALGELTSVTRGDAANPVPATGPVFSTTTFDYFEPSGLLHSVTGPRIGTDGTETDTASFTYDTYSNLTSATSPGNNATPSTTVHYDNDGVGRPITISDDHGNTTHCVYDDQGNLTQITDPAGNIVDATYNYLNQPLTVTFPATGQTGSGRETMTEEYLFPGGHVSSVTARDESGNISGKINYHYGVEGEVLCATIGDITPSAYTYDANYRVTSIIDGNGHTTSYHYDNAAGYLGSILGPDGHSEQFSEYDGCGNLLKYIDPRNVETNYHYDTHGMPTDVSYPSAPSLNTHTNYDAIGRVQSFTDSVGSVSYHYDVNDIVTDVTRGYTGGPTKTLSYSYYPDGSRQSMNTPGGIFQYAYDDQGRPTTLTGPSSISAAWDYTTHSSLHKQTLGNGVETTYTYNTAETILQDIKTKKESVIFSDFNNFGFDTSDNLLSVNSYLLEFPNLSGTTSFEYDAQDQLTKETTTRGGGNVLNFEYDHAGNPTSFAGTSNSFNAANRNTAVAYDNAGNPATHDGTLLTFDAENHMTAHGTNFSAGYTASGCVPGSNRGQRRRTISTMGRRRFVNWILRAT